MSLDMSKYKVMHFGAKNPNNSYKLMGSELAITEKAKALGVKINSSMKVLSQCSSTAKKKKKGNSTLGIIRNDIENRDANIFVPLYKSMLRWNIGCSFGHYTSKRI